MSSVDLRYVILGIFRSRLGRGATLGTDSRAIALYKVTVTVFIVTRNMLSKVTVSVSGKCLSELVTISFQNYRYRFWNMMFELN